MLITHVYSNEIMRPLSSQLTRILPGNHPVTLISHAGLANEQQTSATLSDLADHPGGSMLAIYVPPLPELEATRDPATLQHIMARLRGPEGCPWDRKQDNASLAQSLIDEVYEVVDAIESGDDANFAEELGDLLMLIMMHAQIAEERGAFILEDVYDEIATKIVRRHPHVFGEMDASNPEEVVGLWQKVKAEEKAARPDKPEKAADGQPHSMPAMTRAPRVLKKHPIDTPHTSAEERQKALLDVVSAIVVAGDDPEQILKEALINHVAVAKAGQVQGE